MLEPADPGSSDERLLKWRWWLIVHTCW